MEVLGATVRSRGGVRLLAGALIATCAACHPDASVATAGDQRLASVQEAYYRGQYDSAALGFEALRAAAEADGDTRTVAAATMWLAYAARERGVYDSARIHGERAVALQAEHGLTDLLPRAYNALGLLAWEEYRLADAESLFVRSRDAAEEADLPYAAAVAQGNLGLVSQDLGDYDAARRGYAAQLETSLRYDSARAAETARMNLASLSIREGDPVAAVDQLNRAIAVFRSLDDRARLQNALAQLAEAYADLGEPRLAFAAFDTAVAIARAVGDDAEVARNLDALAALHQRTGNMTRAIGLYADARAIYESLGHEIEAAWSLRNSASIYAALGDIERARNDAERAASIHAAAGLPIEQIDDRVLLAEIARLEGDTVAALEHLDDAWAVVDRLGVQAVRLRFELVRARFEIDDDRAREAVERLSAVREEFAQLPADTRAEGLGLLARALARVGDATGSAVVGGEAVAALERMRGRFGSSERRATFLNDRLDVYGDLATVLFQLGRVEEGFAVADAARGRGLAARLSSGARASSAISAVAAGERLLSRIHNLDAELDSAVANDAQGVGEIRAQLEEARRAYEEAYRDAREQLGVDAPLLGLGAADLGDVQEALAPNEALVEFLVGEDRVWSIVVTPDAVRPLSADVGVRVLSQRVRIARDLVASPSNGKAVVGPVTRGLHEILLGEARRSGLLDDVQLLTIVPHTVLNYVPFAALVDEATDRYLVEDFDVRYLPSASALPALARRPDSGADDRAALFAPLDRELPETLREVDAIETAIGTAARYAGNRASERRVRDALGRRGVVHVATHGVMNARNPMFSRIELAAGRSITPQEDGRLEVHEVLELDIRSRLVFLSGCETGVGAAWAVVQGRGEDQTTLEMAFLYAGAANVISTLWPIDDRGAAVLGGFFYGSRVSTPAERLGEAQRTMLREARWAAPYYWAGYRLSGTNRMGPAAAP